MEIIVPAAGLSTRFPNTRPKYLLYDYKNTLMIRNAVEQFIGSQHKITVGILKEHAEKYNAVNHITNAIPDVNVVVLEDRTKGPADTVYQILKHLPNKDVEILIKDCDSFFTHEYQEGNYVCVSSIDKHEIIKKLYSKSFVQYNDQGIITNIIEKRVVSDTFCVGGYKFQSSFAYIEAFEKLSEQTDEIFVSHIIQHCLLNNKIFVNNSVENYVDVGTAEDWFEYNNKPVIFCDIDGTLIKAQSRFGSYSYAHDPIVLEGNYQKIKTYYDRGCQIVFTTARPSAYDAQTLAMLAKLGFNGCKLVSGLNNSARILVNDFNEANPYPRAISVNIKRDHDTLKDYL